jgi:hypothetical protein
MTKATKEKNIIKNWINLIHLIKIMQARRNILINRKIIMRIVTYLICIEIDIAMIYPKITKNILISIKETELNSINILLKI